MARLQDKVAVVTGGSSGIGLATAKRFVEEGARVVITGRRQEELDKAVAAIGAGVTAIQGDATDDRHLDELFATVERDHGRLDVLVVSAGTVEQAPLAAVEPASFERTIALNVRAPLFAAQRAASLMKRGGSIVLIGSVVGAKGWPGYTTYAASKAAVRSFARTWTAEFGNGGARVNVISPGPVDTPLIDNQYATPEEAANVKAQVATIVPLGRWGRPEEIAAAALFLASDESSFVAGAEINVDGGIGAV